MQNDAASASNVARLRSTIPEECSEGFIEQGSVTKHQSHRATTLSKTKAKHVRQEEVQDSITKHNCECQPGTSHVLGQITRAYTGFRSWP